MKRRLRQQFSRAHCKSRILGSEGPDLLEGVLLEESRLEAHDTEISLVAEFWASPCISTLHQVKSID